MAHPFQLTESQMSALTPLLTPFVDMVADRIVKQLLPTMANKEPRYYTRAETARLLHVTLPTLHRLTKDGLITAKKVGNRILYEAEAIDAAVKENRMFKYKRAK